MKKIDSAYCEALVKLLREKELKTAAAESLTGGMVSELITSVSGASEILECGICSYSNRIKHQLLGVSENTLETFTEYSIQTAVEMAEGIRKLSGADIGVSTTGIAGPGGGTDEKPVGTVYIGISSKRGCTAQEFRFEGDRQSVRQQTAQKALSFIIEEAEKL